MKNINIILATDCGSTTTKAILIQNIDGEFRLTHRGEAPTTVEAPFEDVTRGVLNSIIELEELSGRKILDGEEIIRPSKGESGIDIYISTSSAGGGLQMMVGGVVKNMTGQSAERAALGAGAIVMDVLSSNDGRQYHQKVERIRQLRPDMILLSGGVDGGTITHVVELSEVIQNANPKPRLGSEYKLPIIFAGNIDAQEEVEKRLGDITDLTVVPNIRPELEVENLAPSRDKIHDLFMEHVMAQAPGYKKLIDLTDAPIMPTPGAVGEIIKKISEKDKINVVGVDIGGATTDVFSVFDGEFNRTVSANLGMSYSVCNVLTEAQFDSVVRWLPFSIDEKELTNRISNKMIRPTTVPQTIEDLKIEQAIAREALRLSFIQHKSFAVTLQGVQKQRTISDAFEQGMSGETIVNMMSLDLLVGSGGVLSHAPSRNQAFRMLIDSFLPEGVTGIAVDSIFMMPQLGVLSTVHEDAAVQVFNKDCLVKLGTCIAPIGNLRKEKPALEYKFEYNSKKFSGKIKKGELKLIEIPDADIDIQILPDKGVDIGEGKGEPYTGTVSGGVVGIVFDARGRNPLDMPDLSKDRIKVVKQWSKNTKEFIG